MIGVESGATGHREKWISAIGGFIAIFATLWVSAHYLDQPGAVLLVASMGASAVLLFAVPHGALSQPWPLIGGHFVSVVLGVLCARFIPNQLVAAPLSVGIAIGAMYYLRCLHPPGGASALSAVIGGASVHELGFQYVLTPVMLNAAVMLLIALVWNNLFAWRRYPAYFKKQPAERSKKSDAYIQLNHADFEYALREIGSYIDITEQDLTRIYKLAVKHGLRISDQSDSFTVGNYYTNGEYGRAWAVRKIMKVSGNVNAGDAVVAFKVVAGNEEGEEQTVTQEDFSSWQQYEVIFENGIWHRIMPV